MKRNKEFTYLILAILVVWVPLFMAAFDKDKPSSSTSLRNSNPEILANWDALETAIGQDHEFSTGGTNSGKHEVLTMEEETSAGASSTNELHVQAIDGGSGQPEFAVTSEDGDELQMTKDGDLFSSDGLVVTEGATFNGDITLGDGDDLIGSSTSDITFNTNKFTVVGATGNTVIAGTCDITGATEITGIATLGDGSLLKTSAAPTTDAMITNKKYVDDQNHKVAQIVQTSYAVANSVTAAIAVDDSIPQNSEGEEIVTLAITPTSASNELKIEAIVPMGFDNASVGIVCLFQDTTADALAVTYGYAVNTAYQTVSLIHYMTAGTTSATTFKIRVGVNAAGVTINGIGGNRRFGGVSKVEFIITEYVP